MHRKLKVLIGTLACQPHRNPRPQTSPRSTLWSVAGFEVLAKILRFAPDFRERKRMPSRPGYGPVTLRSGNCGGGRGRGNSSA